MRWAWGWRISLEGPGGGVEPAPGVAACREPGPPIADVLEAAGGQQAALEFLPAGGASALTNDPIGAGHQPRGGAAQPGGVARETVMFGQAPEYPAVMLVVAAGLVTAGAIENAVLGGEVAGQAGGALVMQPGLEAFPGFPVIAAPVQVHHHHARFIAVGAVTERTDARKAPGAVGLPLAVDEQMARLRPIELVEHRLRRDEAGASIEPSAPIAGNGGALRLEVEPLEGGLFGFLRQHEVWELDHERLGLSRRQGPGPAQAFSRRGGGRAGQDLSAQVCAEPEPALLVGAQAHRFAAGAIGQGQRGAAWGG